MCLCGVYCQEVLQSLDRLEWIKILKFESISSKIPIARLQRGWHHCTGQKFEGNLFGEKIERHNTTFIAVLAMVTWHLCET